MTRLLVNISDEHIDCLRDVARQHNLATGEVAREIIEGFLDELVIPVMIIEPSVEGQACSNCGKMFMGIKEQPGYFHSNEAEAKCQEGRKIGNAPELTKCPQWIPREVRNELSRK